MKLYALLEERGLPLAFHAATTGATRSMRLSTGSSRVHALGFTWFNMLH